MRIVWILSAALALGSCTGSKHRSDAYGNFEGDEIIISSEIAGKVLFCGYEEGDRVDSGDLLCLVDTSALYLQRQQLLATRHSVLTGIYRTETLIDVQKSQRNNLERDLRRIEKMLTEQAATQKQYDDIHGQLDVMDRQILSSKSQIASIHAEVAVIDTKIQSVDDQLAHCRIDAPQNGVVLSRFVEPGEVASMGKPLFKLANLDWLYLRAYISGDMLPLVKMGQKVEVFIDLDENQNQSLEGQVTWISSSAEFTPKIIQTKKERVDLVYAIKVKVANDGRLKIGMPGEVVLKTVSHD